jgi:hypothetical protein
MSHRSLSLPVVLTIAFTILVAMLMFGVLPSPIAVAQVDCDDEYRPPNLSYDDCKKTATAEAGGPRATNTPGSGGGGGSQPVVNTSTATLTRTPTTTQATAVTTPTLASTITPTVQRQSGQQVPTPTPTSFLPEGTATLVCIPGSVVALVGDAPPGTALLAFFDERPVGGGFSRADGSFSIDLLIGDERPGLYLVEVRERASNATVQQIGCEVPGFTPTPTADPAP